ncbi:MAG TPA: asparagine synthase-related protein [Candidatus Acidoferrales bacterium]|nr:asparagine synthase-related protein [Candidatus Acidoferrales bacterium]
MGSGAQLTQAELGSPAAHLRRLLENAVERSTADGILLSGGLDTSVLSAIAAKQARTLRALSVSVAGVVSPDEPFAKMMAERCGFTLHVLRPSVADLVAAMPAVMRVLGGFDPMELRNSVVAWLALKAAREEGIAAVLTGDAADELFAGYSYIVNMPSEQVRAYLDFLNGVMRFSSLPMGASLGVEAQLPYLDSAVRDFALTMSRDDLIVERDGQRFGKKVLRGAFADLLPQEITWRVKTPIEYGSGSRALQKFVADLVSDEEFETARVRLAAEDGVSLRDKEQFFYYRIYRTILPPPHQQTGGARRCTACGGVVERAEQKYCRVCGAYPC